MDAEQPVHDPKQEQALRAAAFDRAREKLAEARHEDHRIRTKSGTFSRKLGRRSSFFNWFSFLLLAGGCIFVMYFPKYLPFHFAPDPVLNVLLVLLVVVTGFCTLRKAREQAEFAKLDRAEQRIRHFYSRVASDDQWGLTKSVVASDLRPGHRRVPNIPLPMIFPYSIESGEELTRYWSQILKLRPGRALEPEISRVRILDVDSDLKLALIRLNVREVKRAGWLPAVFVATAGAVIFSLLDLERYASIGTVVGLWTITFAVLGLIFKWVWDRLRVMATHKRRVRKLLVRQGDDWKLFCGDWEGWEEADLSWLDADKAPKDRPIATARGSE